LRRNVLRRELAAIAEKARGGGRETCQRREVSAR
jgi:hypothetical protein